jgi:predicted O-methyltransferase YrrM
MSDHGAILNSQVAFEALPGEVAPAADDHSATLKSRIAINNALESYRSVDLSWIEPEPSDDGWTLASGALRFLTSLVQELQPEHILEFGSGLSTKVLARACRGSSSPCEISSVDHDPEFGAAAAREYSAAAVENCGVTFQIAPVVVRDCGGKMLPVYNLQSVPARPVDLVVIDGPPAILGGREGVLYQAMDSARSGTIAIVDDSARSQEKEAIAHWQDNLGDAIELIDLPGFAKGLAAVIIRTPIPRSEFWMHRLHLTRQDIETQTESLDRVIVAGDEWWVKDVGTGRVTVPFLEHEGQYWGAPPDDGTALRELERLRGLGANYFVLGWPAFWWADCYPEFYRYLKTNYRRVLQNDRVVIFSLKPEERS